MLNRFLDFIVTVVCLLLSDVDTIVAANNFDALAALTAASIRRHRRVVYFASDFAERRFPSRLLNGVYSWVERKALARSSLVVSNTRRAESKRLQLGLTPERSVVVPNGIDLGHRRTPTKEIRRDRFIYVGSVTREHGLYEMLLALAPFAAEFVVVGDGSDWDRVAALCESVDVPSRLLRSSGHEAVLDLLASFSGFGLAPYNASADWTYFCSPMKVVEYVASGLPVIISSVPEIAVAIADQELGIIVSELSTSDLRAALAGFNLEGFAIRARRFGEAHSNDVLLSRIPLTDQLSR